MRGWCTSPTLRVPCIMTLTLFSDLSVALHRYATYHLSWYIRHALQKLVFCRTRKYTGMLEIYSGLTLTPDLAKIFVDLPDPRVL